MNRIRIGHVATFVFAVGSGVLALQSVVYVSVPWIATALATLAAAEYSVGLTLGWKALDAFSVALREAQSLPKNEREAFRRSSRDRRMAISLAIALLTLLCGVSGGAAIALKSATLAQPGLATKLYLGGAGVGVAAAVFFGLFRQYFSGDDLIAEVRDRVSQQAENTKQIREMAEAGDVGEAARRAFPLRKVASRQ